MCGIVGLIGPQRPEWIEAMTARIAHRGPDGAGVVRSPDGRIALGATRLAIIDEPDGAQPMTSACGRYSLVFNGEIVNAADLRAELSTDGVDFVTDHSDTELLLQMLIHEGEAALPRLIGMFAFAFLDRERGRLLLARDPLGVKPLCWIEVAGRIAFASELRALYALDFFSPMVNRQAVCDYLSLLYVPGEESAVAGVKRIPPGGLLRVDARDGTAETARWNVVRPAPTRGRSRAEWIERIREEFRAAVSRWCVSDVPIAASLSGGLDSGAIVGAMAQAGRPPDTFSLGFEEADEQTFSELSEARRIADYWGTRHTEIRLRSETLLDDLPRMVCTLDEPYGGGLPSWYVFRHAAEEFKVIMTGVGGDELFGGYGKWIGLARSWRARLLGGVPSRAAFEAAYCERYAYFKQTEKSELLAGHAELLPTARRQADMFFDATGRHPADRLFQLEAPWQLAEEFLMMVDRFSMAHGLEARPPLLDQRFVALALSVPAAQRTDAVDVKGFWREAAAPFMPPDGLDAPKRGFVLPMAKWLRTDLRDAVRHYLDPRRLKAQGLFNPALFERIALPHLENRVDWSSRVYALLMFQLWYDSFIEGRGEPIRGDLRAA